ncbi:HEAT repeat domain containing protein [Entamoeba marina]
MQISQIHLDEVKKLVEFCSQKGINCDNPQCSGLMKSIMKYPDIVYCILSIIKDAESPVIRCTCNVLLLHAYLFYAENFSLLLILAKMISKFNTVMMSRNSSTVSIMGVLNTISLLVKEQYYFFFSSSLRSSYVEFQKSLSHLLRHEDKNIRFATIHLIDNMVRREPNSEIIIKETLVLTNDIEPSNRALVCQVLDYIVRKHSHIVAPIIPDIIPKILPLVEDRCESVVIRACNLWGSIFLQFKNDITDQLLTDFIQLLLPLTPLNDCDIITLENPQSLNKLEEFFPLTARKAIGITFNNMVTVFGTSLMSKLFLSIEDYLKSKDWKNQESGIFLFGCIIEEGLTEPTQPIKNQLKTILQECLNHLNSSPIIQYSILWSMSRLGKHITSLLSEDQFRQFVNSLSINLVVYWDNSFKPTTHLFFSNLRSWLNIFVNNITQPMFLGSKSIDNFISIIDAAPDVISENLNCLKQFMESCSKFLYYYLDDPEIVSFSISNMAYALSKFGKIAKHMTGPLSQFGIALLNDISNKGDELVVKYLPSIYLLLLATVHLNPSLASNVFTSITTTFLFSLKIYTRVMFDSLFPLLNEFSFTIPDKIKPHINYILENIRDALLYSPIDDCEEVLFCFVCLHSTFKEVMIPFHKQMIDPINCKLNERIESKHHKLRKNMLLFIGTIALDSPDLVAVIISDVCKYLLQFGLDLGQFKASENVLIGLSQSIILNPEVSEEALKIILQIYDPQFHQCDELKQTSTLLIEKLKEIKKDSPIMREFLSKKH